MFIPTVVFYSPEKQRYAQLIGKFDKETIQEHEQKFINGRLPTVELGEKFTIKKLDCPNIRPEISGEDSGLDDDILKEILAEEEEKRKK